MKNNAHGQMALGEHMQSTHKRIPQMTRIVRHRNDTKTMSTLIYCEQANARLPSVRR